MSLTTDIRLFLISSDPVKNIIGERIFPVTLEKDNNGYKVPAITYKMISPNRVVNHGGNSGLAHPVIQLSCWAIDYDVCNNLADLLISIMEGFSGTMNNRRVYSAFLNNQTQIKEPNEELWQIPLDFEIYHKS